MVRMKPLKNRPHVLVFDSGLGGLSVVNAIVNARLGVELFHLADTAFFPYGEKPDTALMERVPAVIRAGIEATSADLVIVACNTASTLALDVVRSQVSIPVVGVVPAIKPAVALTQTGTIGLLATPKTVTRSYTDQLIAEFGDGKQVLRHGAVGLAGAAEAKLAGETPDQEIFEAAISGIFDQKGGDAVDVVVLACTHYPLVQAELEALAPRPVTWVDSGEAIARRTAHLLQDQMDPAAPTLRTGLTTGGSDEATRRVLLGFGFQTVEALSVSSQL
jgi:glutamate racemase